MSHDLRLERLLDGTPEQVFDAFTTTEAMLEWYVDGPDWDVEVLACDVRAGGTTIVEFGPGAERYHEEMTYSEVDRPNRLVYTEAFTMPDGATFTTELVVTFEAHGSKTMLTIVQTGFPSAEERDGHAGGWPGFIDRLERVVVDRRAA